MRIGVVAYEMEGERTGVGRYLEGLLRGVSELGGPHEWLLFFKGEPFDHPLWSDLVRPIFDQRPTAHAVLWEQLRLPRLLRRHGVEAIVSPSYSLPPRPRLPAVVTVHDLSFERLPEEFSWKQRWRRRLLARRAVHQARRVITGTVAIARELARTYDLAEKKIGVVPLGVEPFGEPSGPLGLPVGCRPPYLLFWGSILPRRRLDLVIEAFSRLASEHPDLRLVLAGSNRLPDPGELERWIAASPFRERILRLGYVAEELLPGLVRAATATFYLSTYEGYGLPPLESLATGIPAIVSHGLALDELWPSYPYRCPRLDAEAVTAAARRLLADENARLAVGRQGRERMALESWRRAAACWLEEIARGLDG